MLFAPVDVYHGVTNVLAVALGQKQTSAHLHAMSALPPES
jgi:hypothetical protein